LPLLQGSLALSNANPGLAPATDQRGVARGSTPDIGSVQLLDTAVTYDAVVTNTADSGPGSLRQAIVDVNAHPGSDYITFDIPGRGVQVITPQTQLPDINTSVVIDGYSQPGSSPNTLAAADNAVIDVEINGQGRTMNGLVLSNSPNSVIDGLSIVGMGFPNSDFAGVLITGTASSGDVIAGNFIGLLPDGTTANANGDGVFIAGGAGDDTIGGLAPGARDILSGNINWGFIIEGDSNVVEGDLIGLGANGLMAVANGNGGVIDQGGSNNVIGGTLPAARNYIGGNANRGLKLTINHVTDLVTSGPDATGNVIEGNWIGTYINGASASAQNIAGVQVLNVSGNSIGVAGAGNVISGNIGSGVEVEGNAVNNTIAGNFIGTDPTGATQVANLAVGIYVDNGATSTVISGNVVSGNGGTGILLGSGDGDTTISGNIVGLNAAGSAALGNGVHGIQVFTSSPVLIGGDTPSARNVISGNASHGVALNGSNTTVVGNYIGTDITGTFAIGNGASGIGLNAASGNTIGDTTPGGGNVISANALSGIEFFNFSDNNTVVHNLIGTAANGTSPLGNGRDGIDFLGAENGASPSFDNQVGEPIANGGNVIAFNPNGVVVQSGSTSDTISANSIFGNSGLGIFLEGSGNNSITAPTLTAVSVNSVSGTLSGVPAGTYRIEFFANAANSAPGEGMTFIGSGIVTTDKNGNASFNIGTANIPPGLLVSATATGVTDPLAGDTSQFSQYLAAPLPLARFQITPSSTTTVAGQFVSFTITAVDGNGMVLTGYQGTVAFTSGGTDGAPTLPAQYTFTAADAGSHTFSATYFTAGAQTFTATDILNGAFGSASVLVGAAAFDHLTLTGLSSATPVGVQNTVTVDAVDRFGNIVSTFTDSVQFSSNDSLAQLPGHGLAVMLVNGVGSFAVTFRGLLPLSSVAGQSVRIYSLTVTDVQRPAVVQTETVALPLYLLPSPVQFVAVENTPFANQLVATFLSDLSSGTSLSAGDFTAMIDWGDGSPDTPGTIKLLSDGSTFAVYGDHTYPTGQTDYPIDVTIVFAGFSAQPVTDSVAAVLTDSQFANLTAANVTRAIGTQTTLLASTANAAATLTGASSQMKTTLFVADYANNPVPGTSVQGVSYYDLRATNPVGDAQLAVTFRFQAGAGVPELEYFDPTQNKYVPVEGSTRYPPIQVGPGVLSVTVVFDSTSMPTLATLKGSVFTIVLAPIEATTQNTISPAVAIAYGSGSGLTVTRDVSFQASGLVVGLRPSQDVTAAVARADLSGGGDDGLADADPADLDAIFSAFGIAQSDEMPGVAPAPVAAPAPPPPKADSAVGPGAALPPARPATEQGVAEPPAHSPAVPGAVLPTVKPADAVFVEASEKPFAFPRMARLEQLSPRGALAKAAPSLLAVPLLGAAAVHPPLRLGTKKRRRLGEFLRR
jgi:hypothetical protein